MDIHTNASMRGWGFHTSEGVKGSGLWSPQFKKLHINILEIATIYIAINSRYTKRDSYQSPLRQFHHGALYKQGRVREVPCPKWVDPITESPVEEERSPPLRLPYCGSKKCDRRCPFQRKSYEFRVDSRQESLQVDLLSGPETRDRPLRDEGKSPTSPILFLDNGPSVGENGRLPGRLEQLELPIPLSSLPNDFEGFEKTRRLPGGCVLRSPILAKSTLVSASAGESSEVGNDPESPSPSVSRERNFLLQLLDPSLPNHVDFLREAYTGNLSRESAEVLIQSIRKSSRRQYKTA